MAYFDRLLLLQVKMLEYRHKRLELEPLRWNSVFQPSEGLDSLEFRKVICRGNFDEEKSIFVGPRSRSISGVTENGYYVITPLLPIPNDLDRCIHLEFCSLCDDAQKNSMN